MDSYDPCRQAYSFPDVSTCKKVLVCGLGGGCDVLSACVFSRTAEFFSFSETCLVVCADTKDESIGLTDKLPRLTNEEKAQNYIRGLPNDQPLLPRQVPKDVHYLAIAMTQQKGALKSPWLLVLPERETNTLTEELAQHNFDLIIGIDAGGDSVVDEATSGSEGRDKRMVNVLRDTKVPFIHIVLGFGSDGESTKKAILKALKHEDDAGTYQGCFHLAPMLEKYRAQAQGLGHNRTPNIICNALEEKKLDRRKDNEVVVPRGIRPQLPLAWLKHGFVFVYDHFTLAQ